jgi:hypothetical protein
LTLNGDRFQDGAIVSLSPAVAGVSAATFLNQTQLQVIVTAGAGDALGFRKVDVTNPDGGKVSLANALEVKDPPPAGGVLNLTVAGGAAAYLPSVAAVQITLGADGKCVAPKTVTPVGVLVTATYAGGLVPPAQVTFTLTSSAIPGTSTNDDCEPANPAAKDFGIGPAQTLAQSVPVNAAGNTYTTTLWSYDWGGTVTIAATGLAGGATPVSGSLALPLDADPSSSAAVASAATLGCPPATAASTRRSPRTRPGRRGRTSSTTPCPPRTSVRPSRSAARSPSGRSG